MEDEAGETIVQSHHRLAEQLRRLLDATHNCRVAPAYTDEQALFASLANLRLEQQRIGCSYAARQLQALIETS
jgi:hypothetical protein